MSNDDNDNDDNDNGDNENDDDNEYYKKYSMLT